MIDVRFQRGLYLPEAGLWLDPWDPQPRAFVSHAHADHFARHEMVLCSETTAHLLKSRFRLAAERLDPLAYHKPLERDGFRLRLLPAGHIPGSAMLHLTRLSDNASLLYTGDFKNRRSRTAEEVNFMAADTLILETTFGLHGYEFPNPMEVESQVLRFVHDSFADGVVPVLLGYSLGKAQEALALMAEHGIPCLLHPAAAVMTRACREAGVPGLPEPLVFEGQAPPGHVVIAPPHAARTGLLAGLPARRTAMLTGWAMQPGAKFRYRVDEMIPLSDHADHPGLLECIQRVRPKRVLTVHGFAREFAAELRAKGMDAWSAAGGDQLELPIHHTPQRQPTRNARQMRVLCSLADFTDLCRLVAETGSRVAKAGFLRDYLAGLADDDLRVAARLLADAIRPARTGRMPPATLRHALAEIPGGRAERFREIHHHTGDPVYAARLFLHELHLQPAAMTLAETADFLTTFRENPRSLESVRRLARRLATLHPAEGETLVGLLAGNLHLGIDAAMFETAMAEVCGCDSEKLRQSLAGAADPGDCVEPARHDRLPDASHDLGIVCQKPAAEAH